MPDRLRTILGRDPNIRVVIVEHNDVIGPQTGANPLTEILKALHDIADRRESQGSEARNQLPFRSTRHRPIGQRCLQPLNRISCSISRCWRLLGRWLLPVRTRTAPREQPQDFPMAIQAFSHHL